jgi:hypothetical protein
MKLKVTNVLFAVAVIVAVLYAYKAWTTPTLKVILKEGYGEQSAGSILGMVFAGILGVGILVALVGALSEGGSYGSK